MYIKITATWSNGTTMSDTCHNEAERAVWQAELNDACRKKGWSLPTYTIERENRPFTREEAAQTAVKAVMGNQPVGEPTDRQRQLMADIIAEYTK